jgi:hypothetical protein
VGIHFSRLEIWIATNKNSMLKVIYIGKEVELISKRREERRAEKIAG